MKPDRIYSGSNEPRGDRDTSPAGVGDGPEACVLAAWGGGNRPRAQRSGSLLLAAEVGPGFFPSPAPQVAQAEKFNREGVSQILRLASRVTQ